MSDLSCSITLLADFEVCNDPFDWVVGEHGIRISFRNKPGGRKYSATYLPDVASEQGWTREEALESLMRKSGWEDPEMKSVGGRAGRRSVSRPSWEKVDGFKVTRYKGLKASATFGEWEEFREWVEMDEARCRLLHAQR